jgi:DNA polymerase epsilon subunit 1
VCADCRFSDALLTNLWRWLCSPAAALACAGLQRTVTGLMRKTLAQLVADLKRLGARVVAADAHSVILATGKSNLTAAVGCAPISKLCCGVALRDERL